MLVLLWLFQVVFLDSFYKLIKSNMIKNVTSDIVKNIDEVDLDTYISEVSQANDVCIVILDSDKKVLNKSNGGKNVCVIPIMNDIRNLYNDALDHDGSAFSKAFNKKEDNRNFLNESKRMEPKRRIENMTYLKIVEGKNQQEYIIVVNAMISPVDATVETLRSQLLIVSAILLFVAMILSLMMSRKISKPIIHMNESANKLAQGDYDVKFDGNGYLEIKELNDTLNYAAKELSKVEDLRRELIANMSHDLRTPLTMIAGYGEIMRDIPNENTPQNVQIIIDETKRLTSLVNDILDLSKLQSGSQSLNIENYAISEDIRNIIKRYKVLLNNVDYQIITEIDCDIIIQADPIKINQVIYNLLNNAITYMGEDHRVIIRQITFKDKIRIEIEDHGQGIAKEDLDYVWDRYYKVDKVHVRSRVGTGLGLSIVKNILELHCAKYGVVSVQNESTNFWFELSITK